MQTVSSSQWTNLNQNQVLHNVFHSTINLPAWLYCATWCFCSLSCRMTEQGKQPDWRQRRKSVKEETHWLSQERFDGRGLVFTDLIKSCGWKKDVLKVLWTSYSPTPILGSGSKKQTWSSMFLVKSDKLSHSWKKYENLKLHKAI